MKLMTCPDCNSQISRSAVSCPKCGRPISKPPAPKRETSRLTWAVVTMLVLGTFLGLSQTCSNESRRAQLTPAQRAAEDEKKASYDTAGDRAVAGARRLRSAMRNPDSFAIAKVFAEANGEVCYTYRAQNGFGGMNGGQAILFPDDTIKTSIDKGFAHAWSGACLKPGWDMTTIAK